jgi:hypothetical protein
LIKLTRTKLLLALPVLAVVGSWLYLNRPVRSDLSAYAPADSLAFVETNDLLALGIGVEQTAAWKSLAGPMGARTQLLPNPWLVRLARWTGIGTADAILIARSQVAMVFGGAEARQDGSTLTIKPLTNIIIETHTSQKRMRSSMEGHMRDFAQRLYKQPVEVRKQLGGIELTEWTSVDGTRQIVVAFTGTAVIVGNDEASVVRCVEVRTGKRAPLSSVASFNESRTSVNAATASVFGFVSKAGVKSLLQAYVLFRNRTSPNAPAEARIFADTIGNLAESLGWSARFVDGMVEDRCAIKLADGIAEKLRDDMVPQKKIDITSLPFVPQNVHSVSIYNFRDVEGVWRDLNAVISSHADLLGAVATRPLLQSLLKPYGIEDADTFVHSVGAQIQTVRLDEDSPSVLVTEAFDRQGLRKLVQRRLGPDAKTEINGDTELSISAADNWSATIANNYFLTGPAEQVRRCLEAKAASSSLTSTNAYRKSQALVDVSLPLTVLTFTDDQKSAISFVELFSQEQRSTFSTNAAAVDQAVKSLPYAVSVSILKEPGFEWTSRSSFGLLGSLLVRLAPEKAP